MELDFQKIYALLFSSLIMNSPILSGNMQSMIQLGQIGESYAEIIIDAPPYDMKKWQKEKVVITIPGLAYAKEVNDAGAFGTHNKSEHWVNRQCYNACEAVANEIGAILINELPL